MPAPTFSGSLNTWPGRDMPPPIGIEQRVSFTDSEVQEIIRCQDGCWLKKLQDWVPTALIPCLMVCVIVFGATDVIAGKIRAEPLGDYDGFVTAMLNAMVYFYVYGSIFFSRYMAGRIDIEQVRFVWHRRETGLPLWVLFAAAGLCDVMAQILQFMAQPYLSVIVFQLMLQAQVPFTVVFTYLILKTRYIRTEILGVAIVILGSTTAIWQIVCGPIEGASLSSMAFSFLVVLGAGCTAMSFVLKELVFKTAERAGTAVDVFVVNSGCALFTLLWSCPVSLLIEGVRHQSENPFERLSAGFACLGYECPYALESYAVYMGLNIFFNLSVYGLVAAHSALLTFVCMKLTTPGAALLSYIDWPLIGSHAASSAEWVALFVILLGVGVFRYGNVLREQMLLELDAKEDLSKPLLTRQASAPAIIDAAPILTRTAEYEAVPAEVEPGRCMRGTRDVRLAVWKQHYLLTVYGCPDAGVDCCVPMCDLPPLHCRLVHRCTRTLDGDCHMEEVCLISPLDQPACAVEIPRNPVLERLTLREAPACEP